MWTASWSPEALSSGGDLIGGINSRLCACALHTPLARRGLLSSSCSPAPPPGRLSTRLRRTRQGSRPLLPVIGISVSGIKPGLPGCLPRSRGPPGPLLSPVFRLPHPSASFRAPRPASALASSLPESLRAPTLLQMGPPGCFPSPLSDFPSAPSRVAPKPVTHPAAASLPGSAAWPCPFSSQLVL